MKKYIDKLEKTKMDANKEMILMEKENVNHSDLSENKKYISLGKLLEDISRLQRKFMKYKF